MSEDRVHVSLFCLNRKVEIFTAHTHSHAAITTNAAGAWNGRERSDLVAQREGTRRRGRKKKEGEGEREGEVRAGAH